MNMFIYSDPWVISPSDWSLEWHIIWFIGKYIFSFYIISQAASSKKYSEDYAGWLKPNKFLKAILFLKLYLRDDGKVFITAITNQIILQVGAIWFIVMTMRNPDAVAVYSRVFSGVVISLILASGFVLAICRGIYLLRKKRGRGGG